MEDNTKYTLSILSENNIGLMQKVVTAFTRRKINIDSFTGSETENKDIYRITILVQTSKGMVKKVANSLEQIIDVFRVVVYEDKDLVHQELALYKVPTKALLEGSSIENIIRKNNARILFVGKEMTVIEKTGHKQETQELFDLLTPYNVLGFSRSGRISLSNRDMTEVNKFLAKQLKKDKATFVKI